MFKDPSPHARPRRHRPVISAIDYYVVHHIQTRNTLSPTKKLVKDLGSFMFINLAFFATCSLSAVSNKHKPPLSHA